MATRPLFGANGFFGDFPGAGRMPSPASAAAATGATTRAPTPTVGAVDPHTGGGFIGNELGLNGNALYDGWRRFVDTGFLEDLGYGLATTTNIGDAFGAAAVRGAQMRPEREQRKRSEQTRNQTMEWLQSKGYDDLAQFAEATGDYGAAWTEGLRRNQPGYGQPELTADMRNFQYAQEHPEFASFLQGSGSQPTTSTQPQYFRDPETGEIRLGQLSSTGQVVWSDTNGLTPLTPGDISQQRAYGTAAGKGLYGAQEELGPAETSMNAALGAIERLRDNKQGQSEQFGRFLGVVPNQWLPVTPGTSRGNFKADMAQANGQAFLQARQFLKGQGQITDFESQRAEAAFSRLQAAADNGDQNAFNDALDDFEAAVKAGYAKVLARSGQGGGSAPGANNDYRNRYGLE